MITTTRQPLSLRAKISLTAIVVVFWGWPKLGLPTLVYNETGVSMPTGLYVYKHSAPFKRGETIIIRSLDPLKSRDGTPLYWPGALVKNIVGVPGDQYCWDEQEQTHRLNGKLMQPPGVDRETKEIEPWKGCQTLEPDQYVGYTNHPRSFDSRFIGPIKQSKIMGSYMLIRH